MSEGDHTPKGPETFVITNSGPRAAIDTYFSRGAPPPPEKIVQAAGIITAPHREIEHTQYAMDICDDLARDVPEATTVLAAMIGTGHEAVPPRWVSDPDDIRMVLSMVGYLEIGQLRAQQAAVRRGAAFPELSDRVLEIEQLIEDLG